MRALATCVMNHPCCLMSTLSFPGVNKTSSADKTLKTICINCVAIAKGDAILLPESGFNSRFDYTPDQHRNHFQVQLKFGQMKQALNSKILCHFFFQMVNYPAEGGTGVHYGGVRMTIFVFFFNRY